MRVMDFSALCISAALMPSDASDAPSCGIFISIYRQTCEAIQTSRSQVKQVVDLTVFTSELLIGCGGFGVANRS